MAAVSQEYLKGELEKLEMSLMEKVTADISRQVAASTAEALNEDETMKNIARHISVMKDKMSEDKDDMKKKD